MSNKRTRLTQADIDQARDGVRKLIDEIGRLQANRTSDGVVVVQEDVWETIVSTLRAADSYCSLVVHRRHEFENPEVREELGKVSAYARAILRKLGR